MTKFHIICRLPNASTIINGIEFAAHAALEGAMRTVKAVEADVADLFREIPGYSVEEAGSKATDEVVFPPTDEQVDGMKPGDVSKMLKAQSFDFSTLKDGKDNAEKSAALKALAAKAREAAAQ